MHSRKVLLTVLAGLTTAGIGLASATTLQELTLDDMVAESAVVIEGTVESSTAANTDGGIYTTTVVQVNDAIVGEPGGTVEVVTPGGVVESGRFRIGETNASAPVFLGGQDLVLFLGGGQAAGQYSVVGYSQGVMPIMQTSSGPAVQAKGEERPVPLSKMKERIKAIKASQKGR